MSINIRKITKGAVIASLYVVFTLISSAFGLSSGPVQLRLSEMLCILPVFTSAAVPGLFFGCLLSNIIIGAPVIDIIFGSIATVLGAFGTYYIKKNKPWVCSIPPILSNSIILPLVIVKAYHLETVTWIVVLGVFTGEVLSCGILGVVLYSIIKNNRLYEMIND